MMHQQLGISIHNVGIDYITKNRFKRVQLCHKFSGAKEITSLIKLSRKQPIKVAFHAPVFHQTDPNMTYYLDSNKWLRKATFEILETNLKMTKSLPTDHVVVHFTSQHINEEISDETLTDLAKDSIDKLGELSHKYGIPIYLEYAGYNRRFYRPEVWVELVKDYDQLGICLDTGHLATSCELNGLNYFESLEMMLPVIKAAHLWNTRGIEDMKQYSHVPVHPSQRPEDGWIDMERTIEVLLTKDKTLSMVFEPDFKYGSIEYAREGMDWVNGLVYQMTGKEKRIKSKASG